MGDVFLIEGIAFQPKHSHFLHQSSCVFRYYLPPRVIRVTHKHCNDALLRVSNEARFSVQTLSAHARANLNWRSETYEPSHMISVKPSSTSSSNVQGVVRDSLVLFPIQEPEEEAGNAEASTSS